MLSRISSHRPWQHLILLTTIMLVRIPVFHHQDLGKNRNGDFFRAQEGTLWPTGGAAGFDPGWGKEGAEHIIEFLERGRVHGVIHPSGIQRILLHLHQPGLTQDFDVMRDKAGRHFQKIAQFTVAMHAFKQQIQNEQPFGFGQDFEPFGQVVQVGGGCNCVHQLVR